MSVSVYPVPSSGIQETIVNAKGDIIAATAADTVARLAVGSNNTVLIADSAEATGLKWGTPAAGGMTLLSTTTLSSTATTISISASTYKNLFIEIEGVSFAAADKFTFYTNNQNVQDFTKIVSVNGTNYSSGGQDTDTLLCADNQEPNNATNKYTLQIFDINQTTKGNNFQIVSGYRDSSIRSAAEWTAGLIVTTSACTSITFDVFSTGSFGAGTVRIYGVN